MAPRPSPDWHQSFPIGSSVPIDNLDNAMKKAMFRRNDERSIHRRRVEKATRAGIAFDISVLTCHFQSLGFNEK